MSDDPTRPVGEYELELPAWTVAKKDPTRLGLPNSLANIGNERHGQILALFTDRSLAEDFIKSSGRKDWMIAEVENVVQFRKVLTYCKSKGITRAIFDLPDFSRPPDWRVQRIDIDILIAALRQIDPDSDSLRDS